MERIDLSIIIVSYNTKELLTDCVDSITKSLKNSTINYEIIIIDNGSIDGSKEVVRREFPGILLIENKNNAGYGKANNQGVEIAKGKTILFLNSDIKVLRKAIEKLFEFYKTLPEKSIVGGKLFNPDKSPQDSCGPEYSLLNIFLALFCKGDYLHITRYSPMEIKSVDWVMGACIMINKKDFLKLGGFDEGIFMYMEEIDFQHRAKQQGYRILFYPDAHFIHKGAASSHGRSQPILNVFRGFLYFYKKYDNGIKYHILRVILILKAVLAILLFTIMGKKDDQKLYKEAYKLVINT